MVLAVSPLSGVQYLVEFLDVLHEGVFSAECQAEVFVENSRRASRTNLLVVDGTTPSESVSPSPTF